MSTTVVRPIEVRLPVDEFRSLPIPGQKYGDKPSKLATCFVPASKMPAEWADWLAVNPRIPKKNKAKTALSARPARRMIRTVTETPKMFSLKNQGIYILTDRVSHTKEPGGQGVLKIFFEDPNRHGIVNGGHTYFALREVIDDPECGDPDDAWVRLHILENVDPGMIVELAEGLNRSVQVQDKSLANLEGEFEDIKQALVGKNGADKISYREGDTGPVDIQDILSLMAMLNISEFPDGSERHPNTLFGQPTKVLKHFQDDLKNGSKSVYRRMYPSLHEILVLWDRVYEESVRYMSKDEPRLSLLGRKPGEDNQKKNPRDSYFAHARKIDRRVTGIGLLYPIFAAFRANISPRAWNNGKFEWITNPEDLLVEQINQMCGYVRNEYYEQKRKPAEVGKKHSVYVACYQSVQIKLAKMGKLINA